jgi:aspartate carbamoyltransferase regulatory subunit
MDKGEEVKEFKVTPIRNGTVIDHITCNMALKVLSTLGITEKGVDSTVSVLMHVPSKKADWKDVVKVEDRELDAKEVDKIALIAPFATINIIRNYKVAEKHRVELTDTVVGIVKCANLNCITNLQEPVESKFDVISKDPPKLKCWYCEREISGEEILEHIV